MSKYSLTLENSNRGRTCPFLFTPMIPLVASCVAVTKMVSPLILFM